MKTKLLLVATLFAEFVFNTTCVAQAPSITGFSPSSGSVGTLITIIGTNLQKPTAFTVGGVSAIVVSDTSVIPANYGDTLVGLVMPISVTGAVSITTAEGTANGTNNFSVIPTSYPSVQQGNKLIGTDAIGSSGQGESVSISANGNTAIVGGEYDSALTGASWIYTRNGGVWIQQGAKLLGTGGVEGNNGIRQGSSVSISADGNTALVGARLDNDGIGAVWVYTRNGSVWTQQGTKLVGTGAIGAFGASQGNSVSLSADGNTAIEGGLGDDNDTGAVWIYSRNEGVWTQQGTKLVGTGAVGAIGADEGNSVSLSADGKTAMVGGYRDNNDSGAVWVYTRNGSVWTQQGSKLIGTGTSGTHIRQGFSVSLSADGNTAIEGGLGDNGGTGAAWVFTRSGGVWTQQGNKLVGTGVIGAGASQGTSVSLSADGNTAIVGGAWDNSGEGAVWVYTRNGGQWTQQGTKLVGSGASGVGGAQQGFSVSLSADGNTVIVGGLEDSLNGAAWVFKESPTGVENYSSNSNDINVYPMPNDGHFEITFTGMGYQSITIYNEIGKKISTQLLDEKNANISLTLNLSQYPSGIYFAQIITSHGIENKKILIQK